MRLIFPWFLWFLCDIKKIFLWFPWFLCDLLLVGTWREHIKSHLSHISTPQTAYRVIYTYIWPQISSISQPFFVRFSITSRSSFVRLSLCFRSLFVSRSKTYRIPNEKTAKKQRNDDERTTRANRNGDERRTRQSASHNLQPLYLFSAIYKARAANQPTEWYTLSTRQNKWL